MGFLQTIPLKKVLKPFLTSISNTETWTSRQMFSKFCCRNRDKWFFRIFLILKLENTVDYLSIIMDTGTVTKSGDIVSYPMYINQEDDVRITFTSNASVQKTGFYIYIEYGISISV